MTGPHALDSPSDTVGLSVRYLTEKQPTDNGARPLCTPTRIPLAVSVCRQVDRELTAYRVGPRLGRRRALSRPASLVSRCSALCRCTRAKAWPCWQMSLCLVRICRAPLWQRNRLGACVALWYGRMGVRRDMAYGRPWHADARAGEHQKEMGECSPRRVVAATTFHTTPYQGRHWKHGCGRGETSMTLCLMERPLRHAHANAS